MYGAGEGLALGENSKTVGKMGYVVFRSTICDLSWFVTLQI